MTAPRTATVSVIMPMRNAERYVCESIRSVLGQTFEDLELIVIDDGSTDNSASVVRAFEDRRLRLVTGQGRGISAALNTGLDAATGGFVARCDSDDLFPPERLAWHVDWLTRNPDYGTVCGAFSTVDWCGRPVRDMSCGVAGQDINEELVRGTARTHFGTFTVRREVIENLGGFRSYFDGCEDIDMQLRLGQACRVRFEPRSSYVYRLHDASITHRRKAQEREWFDATAKLFAMQRRTRGQDDLELGNAPQPPAYMGFKATSARTHVQNLLVGQSWQHRWNGRFWKAIGTGVRACAIRPQRFDVWKNLAALILKRPS